MLSSSNGTTLSRTRSALPMIRWRLIGNALRVLEKVVPLLDESIVRRVLYRFEIVPSRQVADQVLCIDTGQLFLTDRKGHDWDIRGLDTGIGQFFVEGDVGVAVDRRDHRRLFAG